MIQSALKNKKQVKDYKCLLIYNIMKKVTCICQKKKNLGKVNPQVKKKKKNYLGYQWRSLWKF